MSASNCCGKENVISDKARLQFVNLKPGEQLQARRPLASQTQSVLVRLLVCRGVAVWLRVSVVQAVFATLLGGVVCVQWITGQMCACVVSVCVCVFVFSRELGCACAFDHGVCGHVVCRRRRTQ